MVKQHNYSKKIPSEARKRNKCKPYLILISQQFDGSLKDPTILGLCSTAQGLFSEVIIKVQPSVYTGIRSARERKSAFIPRP